MQTSLVLFEGEKGQIVSYELATYLKGLNVCDAGIGPAGKAVLSNFKKVGVLTFKGETVEIRPKVSVSKLLTLLDPQLRSFSALQEESSLSESTDWTNAIALFFDYQLRTALSRGAIQGYVSVSEWSKTLRGRVEFSGLATAGRFGTSELLVTHDEFTADVIPNQLLLTAIEVLLSTKTLTQQRRKSLQSYIGKLPGVSLLESWKVVPELKLNPMYKHYEPALKTALLVLKSQSVESSAGSIRSNAFLIDMAQLFEFVIERKFEELSEGKSIEFKSQYAMKHLDVAGLFRIKPDFMFFRQQEAIGIADAKYKQVVSESDVATSDINQMIAYCTRFNLKVGHLIYAKAPDFSVQMANGGINLFIHELDLAASPSEIELRLAKIWESINDENSDLATLNLSSGLARQT